MKVSIIIPTYNNILLTKKCLNALKKNTPSEYLDDVFVVDNASSDGTDKYLESLKWVRATSNKENLGFARACNQGAEKAGGDILIFLNNDTEVQESWLQPTLEVFKKEKRVGTVGAKLLFPDMTVQHAGLAFYPDHIPRHIYYQAKQDAPFVNKEREFKAVTAACMAVSKKVFFEVGGFDEDYINGMEDVDLCLKIKERGYGVFYQPKSVVIHHESVSSGRFKHSKHNADIYISRWISVEPDLYKYLKEDGFNAFQRLFFELRAMSYGPNEYGTRPLKIQILRIFFIPLQKVYTLTRLLLRGEFKEIVTRTRERLS